MATESEHFKPVFLNLCKIIRASLIMETRLAD